MIIMFVVYNCINCRSSFALTATHIIFLYAIAAILLLLYFVNIRHWGNHFYYYSILCSLRHWGKLFIIINYYSPFWHICGINLVTRINSKFIKFYCVIESSCYHHRRHREFAVLYFMSPWVFIFYLDFIYLLRGHSIIFRVRPPAPGVVCARPPRSPRPTFRLPSSSSRHVIIS